MLMYFYFMFLDANVAALYLTHYAIYYFVGNIVTASLLTPAGVLADRVGRKPALVGGATLIAASGLLVPFSTAWWQLLFFGGIFSAGSALMTPALLCLVADVSTGYRREKSYSLVSSIGLAFTTVGLVLYMIYSFQFEAAIATRIYYVLVSLLAVILGMVAVIPVAFIRESRSFSDRRCEDPVRPSEAERRQGRPNDVPTSIRKNSVVVKILVINFIVGFGAGFIVPLFTYYWTGVFNLSQPLVTAITILGNVGIAVVMIFTPWIAKNAKSLGGRVGTIVFFEAVSVICATYLALVPYQMGVTPYQVVLYLAISAFLGRQVLMNAISPLSSALVMDHSPANKRGLINSLVSILFAIPNSISPIITSIFLYQPNNPRYAFVLPILILVFLYSISIIIYATIRKADKSMISSQRRTDESR
jgi:MFS family permease